MFFSNRFGFDIQTAEKIFRNSFRKGTFSDLYLQYSVTTAVVLEDGIIKSASRSIHSGTGARVVDGDTTGYSFCESFDPSDISRALDFSCAVASTISDYQPVKGQAVQAQRNLYNQVFNLSDFELIRRVELMKRVLKSASEYSDSIKKITVNLSDTEEHIFIVNSKGQTGSDVRPMVTLSVSTVAEKNGNVQFGRAGGSNRSGYEFLTDKTFPEYYGEEAARQAVTMLSAVQAPAGMMPVVLGAGDSGVLIHESVGHPLEADFIKKKTSAYTGRLGEKVASELCTVVDDGTIPFNRGSIDFDDELISTEKTVLIEKGILKQFMNDRITAKALGVNPTGNGRRESFKYNPIPRMRATYLEDGTHNPEEIIQSVKKGVYCVSFAGGQVDIASGDFVFVPSEAYLIENGKVTVPVKNLTLIGNGPDVLTKIDMAGCDMKISNGTWTCGKGQSAPVGIGLPTVRISEMTVGGAGL